MSKQGKLVNALMKLHFIEDSQRGVKEIRRRIEHYEKRNADLVSKWHNEMPEWVNKEIYDIDTKIRELKWTIYDDRGRRTRAKIDGKIPKFTHK